MGREKKFVIVEIVTDVGFVGGESLYHGQQPPVIAASLWEDVNWISFMSRQSPGTSWKGEVFIQI